MAQLTSPSNSVCVIPVNLQAPRPISQAIDWHTPSCLPLTSFPDRESRNGVQGYEFRCPLATTNRHALRGIVQVLRNTSQSRLRNAHPRVPLPGPCKELQAGRSEDDHDGNRIF